MHISTWSIDRCWRTPESRASLIAAPFRKSVSLYRSCFKARCSLPFQYRCICVDKVSENSAHDLDYRKGKTRIICRVTVNELLRMALDADGIMYRLDPTFQAR
ncbi:hypothetical protein GJ496_010189 [Pomphorhynchus laevis]|nr:hypothetical protein GJ496_010189 [Pomphorhynchus laevis]